jgi:hypothetical protein
VPWIDQAHGKPTDRVEHKYPSSIDELEQMDEELSVAAPPDRVPARSSSGAGRAAGVSRRRGPAAAAPEQRCLAGRPAARPAISANQLRSDVACCRLGQ